MLHFLKKIFLSCYVWSCVNYFILSSSCQSQVTVSLVNKTIEKLYPGTRNDDEVHHTLFCPGCESNAQYLAQQPGSLIINPTVSINIFIISPTASLILKYSFNKEDLTSHQRNILSKRNTPGYASKLLFLAFVSSKTPL